LIVNQVSEPNAITDSSVEFELFGKELTGLVLGIELVISRISGGNRTSVNSMLNSPLAFGSLKSFHYDLAQYVVPSIS
jgi:hypothetical protein